MQLHERYRQNALAYCVAAEKLNADEADAFIAPASLCLAFAIELFLKCVLLKAGKTEQELARKPYGHDLWLMWNLPELQDQRQQANLQAESCFQDLVGEGSSIRGVPPPNTFDQYLQELSRLHTSASNMALRYPEKLTLVPECALLLCVFDRLIRAERLGDKIIRC